MKRTDEQLLAEANALDTAYGQATEFDTSHSQPVSTITKWKVYWDIDHACGVFPDVYDTEEEAAQAAENIFNDNVADGTWDEETCSAEAIEVEITGNDDEETDSFDPIRDGWVGKDGRP